MAQLTLSEKAGMASDNRFLTRVQSSLKSKAQWWLENAAAPSFPDSNTATYKRKVFADEIMKGRMPNDKAYAEYLLAHYTEDPAVLDSIGHLADSELLAGTACEAAFDYFAGVETKDI